MSLYQLVAYVTGYAQAHGQAEPPAPSDDDFDALLRMSAQMDARMAGWG
ncbi:hypothetical protein ACT6QH_01960 [Xanthobacter sp. TB0139]